jgi:hypothetical protein
MGNFIQFLLPPLANSDIYVKMNMTKIVFMEVIMENLIGKVYGRLTVISLANKKLLPGGGQVTMWLCKCSCGNTKAVPAYNLKIGKTKSCGCLNSELARVRRLKHAGTINGKRERLYDIWRAMKERCNDPKNISYHNYGGRGISVCSLWEHDYLPFKALYSGGNQIGAYACFFTPLGKGKSFSKCGNKCIVTSVVVLLFPRCPPAIFR